MTLIDHNIDPNGDVSITLFDEADGHAFIHGNEILGDECALQQLSYPRPIPKKFEDGLPVSAAFESEAAASENSPKCKNVAKADSLEQSSESISYENKVDKSRPAIKIKVSSKHLILASPYFRRKLEGKWAEADTLRSTGEVDLNMGVQNVEAMLIVMNIIHCRNGKVPRSLSLDMLTEVSVLVDFLECHESVEVLSELWIKNLEYNIPTTYLTEVPQWLCISSVFQKQKIADKMIYILARQSKDMVQISNLPVRDAIIAKVNEKRSMALEQLFASLEDLSNDLLHDRISCPYDMFECMAIRYGSLVKGLVKCGLMLPRPELPYKGHSVESVINGVTKIREPQSKRIHGNERYYNYDQTEVQICSLQTKIRTIVQEVEAYLTEG